MSFKNYVTQKQNASISLSEKMVKFKICYLFLAPYGIAFILFYIAPLTLSIFYSFTYYNILEPPKFIGLRNYTNLILGDDVFLTAMKNTFVLAIITGPIGYMAFFLFAWFIHELPRYIRAVVTLVFYAPSISSAGYTIWAIIFSGDAYGYINGFLLHLGILDQPVL
jgi:multiple sugar transport system permease protein